MVQITPSEEIANLKKKINSVSLPPELKEKTLEMVRRLSRITKTSDYFLEYERFSHYVDWIVSLPWSIRSKDILDLKRVRHILNKNHYDLKEIKERILEYLAVLKLQSQKQRTQKEKLVLRAPIICLVGLVGTGKTSLAYSIAQAMGRRFARIPFGGMSSALYLRGQSRIHPEAEPGQIVKALRRCGTKNPVILLDEIDRVAERARGEIMGVLIELLDPEQNAAFNDYFIDYPLDLSEVLFIATCNNTTNISTPVLDRLELLSMPAYSDEEKIIIGRDYVLPRVLKECGLTSKNLVIDNEVWPKIIRPLGYDAGIRTLERTIQSICRKIAKLIVEKKGNVFHVTPGNIKEYLSC